MAEQKELQPGTPEYQEAYAKEMERLEAEAGGSAVTTTKAAGTEDTTTTKADDDKPQETETEKELRLKLERTEKALKDTQRWGHESAARIKKLEQDHATAAHKAARPALLDEVPGLEDAIRHAAPAAATTTQTQDGPAWLPAVAEAIPDINDLLADPEFKAKAEELRDGSGGSWDASPLKAVRDLTDLKLSHLMAKNSASAVEQARKDFQAKARKVNAQRVPGGSGGAAVTQVQTDDVARFQNMSREDLDKERARVMGFSA